MELQKKVVETILLNIRTPESSTDVKINVPCFVKKEVGSTELLGESQKVFAQSYEDLRGFDPGLVWNIMKLAGKKQELVKSALKTPFQRELRDFLRAGMFFSSHPGWVSNWEPSSRTTDIIRTCISLRTFRQEIMRNPSLLSMWEYFCNRL
jgi:hypothetical protein